MTSSTSHNGDGQEVAVTPPVQRQDFDLTQPPKAIPDANTPKRDNTIDQFRSPAVMMRDMGFDPGTGDLTPLEFLVAVMNDDVDKIYRQEKKREMMRKKGIGMNYRVECAKTASRFMHMTAPTVQVKKESEDKFGDTLQEKLAAGNMRVERKTMIIETVQEISPDMPLPEASYPPSFMEGEVVDVMDATDLNAEGDTDYDPDRDD